MQSRQIGRHLKRLAEAGVTAGPVFVDLLEKRYPKYGPLGRQVLEIVESLREEGRNRVNPLSKDGEYNPAPPLTRDAHYFGQQIDPKLQNHALGGLLREVEVREQLLRAEATAGDGSEVSR